MTAQNTALTPGILHRYYLLNKPYNMVSQFTSSHDVPLLGSIDFSFPEGTHAIGRLDKESEGLLLLTTNKKVTRLLFQSPVPHQRVYLVQVRGEVTDADLLEMINGVTLPGKGNQPYLSKPVGVSIVEKPANILPLPHHPFELASTTWLHITLTEGKFHQVRKMVAAVNHRCLRLIRLSIEGLKLDELPPGTVHEIGETEFFEKLNLEQNLQD